MLSSALPTAQDRPLNANAERRDEYTAYHAGGHHRYARRPSRAAALPADSYPETNPPPSSQWGVSMDLVMPVTTATDDEPRRHKIVDGDTLPALAERYLGSAARANEIFDANRDVLPDPELLPIGAKLKIPPRSSRSK